MLSRLTRGQVFAFTLLGLVALAYASIVYVKLPQKLGLGRYEVSVLLPNTSDLYKAAAVTVRGHQVGEVHDLELTDTAVLATLDLDDSAKIPVDSVAEIRSVSAIGEQYLNFVPKTDGGPVLQAGDTVPMSKVKLPTSEVDLLNNVDKLVTSIPTADLNTTVDELSTGFAGTGESLGRLLDSTSNLTATAQQYLPDLQGLISNLGPFLNTQARLSPQLHSIFGDLNKFTGELRRSDPALRGTIKKIPQVQDEVNPLVDDLKDPLPNLLHDLTNVGDVLKVYLPGIQQVLVVAPADVNELQNVVYSAPVFGSAKLNFKAVLNDPPACLTGFLPTAQQRSPLDQTYRPIPFQANCKTPKDSPVGVRDGKNYPCPNGHGSNISASGCDLNFQDRKDAQRSEDEAVDTMRKSFLREPDSRKVPVESIFPSAGSAGYENGALTDNPYAAPTPALLAAQTGFGPRVPLSQSMSSSLASPLASPLSAPLSAPSVPLVSSYDQGTGAFLAPDGSPFLLGSARTSGGSTGDWRSLISGPLGVPTR